MPDLPPLVYKRRDNSCVMFIFDFLSDKVKSNFCHYHERSSTPHSSDLYLTSLLLSHYLYGVHVPFNGAARSFNEWFVRSSFIKIPIS
jgi:hypothetical protein